MAGISERVDGYCTKCPDYPASSSPGREEYSSRLSIDDFELIFIAQQTHFRKVAVHVVGKFGCVLHARRTERGLFGEL